MSVSNPYVGFRKDRAQVAALWEKFHAGMLTSPEEVDDPYLRLLLKEWGACVELGIEPTMRNGLVIDGEDFRRRLADNKDLLDKALPTIERVSSYLFEVPGILLLADREGVVLSVCGDKRVRAFAAEQAMIMEGTCWQESVAGSNGIGSAIRKRAPVHVYSSEHFCEGWHTWTCAGAPILAPWNNEVVGVIDFTTIEKDYRDQAVGLSYSLANSIASEMRLEYELERSFLMQRFQEFSGHYRRDALMVIDRRGKPIRWSESENAQRLAVRSEISGKDIPEDCETLDIHMPGQDGKLIGTLLVMPQSRPTAVKRVVKVEPTAKFGDFLTANPKVQSLLHLIEKVSASDINVLINGETGTGKELVARQLHMRSRRKDGPYIAVNCGTISKELMATAFFGYVGGAFTGADPKGRAGFFEAAHGGTLFLDEIGELPLEIQVALLRVLEDGTFLRVGASKAQTTNCRVLAATNRDLRAQIALGNFRDDLFYRLNVARFNIPPLRDRPEDIRLLTQHFINTICVKHGLEPKTVSLEAWDALYHYAWPGNLRELRNILESAIVCAEGEVLGIAELAPEITATRPEAKLSLPVARQPAAQEPRPNDDADREMIVAALNRFRKVKRVAKELGMSRSTLYRKFEIYGIDQREYL